MPSDADRALGGDPDSWNASASAGWGGYDWRVLCLGFHRSGQPEPACRRPGSAGESAAARHALVCPARGRRHGRVDRPRGCPGRQDRPRQDPGFAEPGSRLGSRAPLARSGDVAGHQPLPQEAKTNAGSRFGGQEQLDAAGPAPARLGLAVVVGAVLGLPGAVYLTALHLLVSDKSPTDTRVVAVFLFAIIEFTLIIVSLILLTLRPKDAAAMIGRSQEWLKRHGRQLSAYVALGLGAYLTISSLVSLLG